MRNPSRVSRAAIAAVVLFSLAAGCASRGTAPKPASASRSWRMGFSALPPRADQAVAVQAIEMWSARADAAILHEDPPWDSLLAGVRADSLAIRHYLSLVQYYRAHGLAVAFEIDATNGLNRAAEAPALVAAGRSIAEPEVRALHRRWVAAVDAVLAPDWLGLASETNLVRVAAPPQLYAALVQLAHEAADTVAAIHAGGQGHAPTLYTSVQVETAWGRLGGNGTYGGIATDLADFPFAAVLGLSSYPYLGGFAEPESLPADWFSRIAGEAARPVMVVEGGWTSENIAGVTSTRAKQARYVRVMGSRLAAAHAIGWWPLTFADLEIGVYGQGAAPFTRLGVVDSLLAPKPALAPWDSLFALPRRP